MDKIKKNSGNLRAKVLFYFLLLMLLLSLHFEPTVNLSFKDGLIIFLVVGIFHFLNERNILFKNIRFFEECVEAERKISEEKENFVANLTHDLKSPAIAQIHALEIILNNSDDLDDTKKSLLNEVLFSCRYMLDMIKTVLYTYKYDEGIISLNKEAFNFKKLCYDVCLEFSHLAKDKGQNIVFNSENDFLFFGDKLQIQRVISNLIVNAINYGDKNSEIVVKMYSKKDFLNFEVVNSGPFISDEKLKLIFEKFKVFNSDKNSNMGLGLYLSKKIVESHEGEIFAKSENGKNYFGFRLPVLVCMEEKTAV